MQTVSSYVLYYQRRSNVEEHAITGKHAPKIVPATEPASASAAEGIDDGVEADVEMSG